MRLRTVSALWTMFLLPLHAFAGQNPPDDFVVHGTINIALGNENGIVVLTDSMLTSGGKQRPDPGQKLFKLDDRTVCSIAGFVSAAAISAPSTSPPVAVPDLNTNTSAIINEFIRQSARQAPQTIVEKLGALASLFKMHLAMIANVRDAAGNPTPIDAYRFQLIVAGYDIDDRPKIGRITLRTKNDGSLFSDIEDASITNVEEKLIWKLNGMPDVATQMLLHPESVLKDAVLAAYAASLRENGGQSLTVEQMADLAKRLAYYTSKAHPEVGGPNQIAIFKKSQAVSINQPTFPEPPRPLFNFSLVVDSHFSYSSVVFAKAPAVFVRCSWTGMQHELDGHYYIGSEFAKSMLMYDGGDVNLGSTNRVTDSVLLLGPHAILGNEMVRRLTASFPSLRVAVPRPKPSQVVP
jgi:20S proteasome alpha/beta subunit